MTVEIAVTDTAKAAVGSGYAGVADGWRRWRSRFVAAGQPATAALLDEARVGPGSRVLDLAGGAGEPGLTLAGLVGPSGHVTVTDLVPGMLQIARDDARARGITNVAFRQADAESLPFTAESFDRVTCRFAVMHFPHAERALAETLRVLRPGGRAAFSVLGPPEFTPSFMTTIGVLMQYVQPPPPVPGFPSPYRFCRPGALVALFRAAGFAGVEETRAVVPSPWPGCAEEMWEALPEHAPGVRDLLAQLDAEERGRVTAEVLTAIRRYDDGGRLNFTQPMIVVSGERPSSH